MWYMNNLLHDKVVLDLPLPGTHDTLTYDLDTTMSSVADGAPKWVPKVLDVLRDLGLDHLLDEIFKIVNTQAITQKLTVVEQLDAGMRFLDLRVSYEDRQEAKGWYGYHFTITKHPFETYLKEIQAWLESHPKEFLMLALTHHGNGCVGLSPFSSNSTKAKALGEMKTMLDSAFGSMLIDDNKANTTTLGEYMRRGRRVLLYVAEPELLGMGLSHCTQVNQHSTGADVTEYLKAKDGGYKWQQSLFSSGRSVNEQYIKENSVHLISGATSSNDCLGTASIAYQIALKFSDNLLKVYSLQVMLRECFKLGLVKMSRATMDLPLTLVDYGWLTNFYSAPMMRYAMEAGGVWALPPVMYLDMVGKNGTFTWGGDGSFPYLGSMLKSKWNKWGSCNQTLPSSETSIQPLACGKQIDEAITNLLKASPPERVDNTKYGYDAEYPPPPNKTRTCALGYSEVTTRPGTTLCVAKPFRRIANQGDKCSVSKGLHCSADDAGVMYTPWEGHASGKCFSTCKLSASPALSNKLEIQGLGDTVSLHSLKDPSKYLFCSKNGTFSPFSDITNDNYDDFKFVIEGGQKDPYLCESNLSQIVSECAKGYRAVNVSGETHCYIEPYQSTGRDQCRTAALSCSYKYEACSVGYSAHAHGNCAFGCYNDCVVNQDGYKIKQGLFGNLHSITDLSKYHICDTHGNWHGFTDTGHDYAFNNGSGKGGPTAFKCTYPTS